jgi:RNA ligase (TIGR02306 family)
MSEWKVRVVKIQNIEKHPNANSLSIINVDGGYPVIFKTTDFKEGDLAVYIPIDSIVPSSKEFEFLGKHRKIVAKRLRGIFSMGLLIPAKEGMKEGDIVDKVLNIEKYEPEIEAIGKGKGGKVQGGETEKDPGFIPVYTDIDGFRKYGKPFSQVVENKEVIVTEKLHGCNCRYLYDNVRNKLWVGSHNKIKRSPFYAASLPEKAFRNFALLVYLLFRRFTILCRLFKRVFAWAKEHRSREIPDNLWCSVAKKYNLEEKLKKYPNVVFYGEIFGQVQDLKYGADKNEVFVRFFDAYDVKTGKYLDWNVTKKMISDMGLETVPILYRGVWQEELVELRNGNTTIIGANHTREGFVVKPTVEMWDSRIHRVILKFVGEDYLLRKGA